MSKKKVSKKKVSKRKSVGKKKVSKRKSVGKKKVSKKKVSSKKSEVKVVMGLETEWSMTQTGFTKVIDKIKRSQKSMMTFLQNGSRIYKDVGHLEFCTPEVSNPKDLVRWSRAQDILIRKAIYRTKSVAFRTSVDSYSGKTFASHESYSIDRLTNDQFMLVWTHLATRSIYTGNGGFTVKGSKFVVSPRIMFQRRSGSQHTNFGICCHNLLGSSKDCRLHIVSGETGSSQLSEYLKFGTTALISLCAKNNSMPFDFKYSAENDGRLCGIALDVSKDVSMKKKYKFWNDEKRTAIEVQRVLLEHVKKCLEEEWMPDWASEVVEQWEDVLNRCENGVDHIADRIDWAIKYNLFSSVCNIKRIAEEDKLRLLTLDLKYGDIRPRSIFNTLDKNGALNHRIVDDKSIDHAVKNAPQDTRAAARSEIIKRDGYLKSSKTKSGYSIDWAHARTTGTWECEDPKVSELIEIRYEFNIGDKIKIKDDDLSPRDMHYLKDIHDKYRGRKGKITYVNPQHDGSLYLKIDIDRAGWWWPSTVLEKVE